MYPNITDWSTDLRFVEDIFKQIRWKKASVVGKRKHNSADYGHKIKEGRRFTKADVSLKETFHFLIEP